VLTERIQSYEKNEDYRMNQLMLQYKEREDLILKEKAAAEDEFKKFKRDTLAELEVKDVLLKRQTNYAEVIKKELAYAKNIIKNPSLFQKAYEQMNFDRVELYKFERVRKQSVGGSRGT